MSVTTYLENRASQAVLSTDENSSISTSVSTLQSRLNAYFNAGQLSDHFRFGSSTRGTILPRKMDAHSDIDYMVVFSEGGSKPQTYLDRLKKFVETKYSTSEIYQSSPTIVLELNHIKFELVPAVRDWWTPAGTYNIPNGPNDWQSTSPNDFNNALTEKNKVELFKLKPTIRLAKFWNADRGYVWGSYFLEKWIVDSVHFGTIINSRDYLFKVFDAMPLQGTQWRDDKIKAARTIIAKVREFEANDMPYSAEAEVKKLIPE